MNLSFRFATSLDAETVGTLVEALTQEICTLTHTRHFEKDLQGTIRRCKEFIDKGFYTAIIAFANEKPVAVATIAETHALYATGKIGIVQEFYVLPDYRSCGIGEKLISQVRAHGQAQQWACMELCTPPLPEFERTLAFYQKNGLLAVGGRKMRLKISA